ncbi:hypothetical protein [Sphingomonas mucosissima]|uniref:Membrane domain of glycerophosphoryl diester phosphodiesterase n=1 Tax=Sphingomonas mucosissima TaxID=370959 RepID=A0A245ZEH6_9SPHN|nr:hypothetical protein [Sphingomonas mucosissima]OWK28147.1 membrane domain of glycerophosphoryl diester phosphodiesterase [Sphingomonas mucosissima]
MTITFARLLADGWAVFRREANLVLALAGALVFLPAFAVQLLCDSMPPLPAQPSDEAAMAQWMAAVSTWGQGNALWYLLADVVGMVGLAAIAMLLIAPGRLTVGDSLIVALRRLGRFVLLNLLVAIPVGMGLWLFVLPGLYIQARLIAAVPVVAAEPGQSAARALGRSWRLTNTVAWATLGAVVSLFLMQWLAVSPLFSFDSWLRQPEHDNPFLIALVAALLAAAGTFYNLGLLLVGVAVYRRFANSGT